MKSLLFTVWMTYVLLIVLPCVILPASAVESATVGTVHAPTDILDAYTALAAKVESLEKSNAALLRYVKLLTDENIPRRTTAETDDLNTERTLLGAGGVRSWKAGEYGVRMDSNGKVLIGNAKMGVTSDGETFAFDSDVEVNGTVTADFFTGDASGLFNLPAGAFAMDQDVRTTDSPTFAALTVTGTAILDGADVGLTATTVAAHTVNIAANTAKLDQNVLTTSSPTFATVDTGNGANELYAMNQDVLTTSNPTFAVLTSATLNTGQGNNELYAMDQNVMTTSSPTFAGVTAATLNTGQGNNELYAMNQNVLTTSSPTFAAVTAGTINTGQGNNELYAMNQNVMTSSAVSFTTINTGFGANELYQMNQNVMTSSAVSFTTIDTGFGANELYQMNQDVLTTSSPTFAAVTAGTINTGQGNNELYAMNQNVMTSSAVSFTTIDTGFGANELYQMNQNVMTSSAVSFTTIDTGFGANELYQMNQDVLTTSSPTFAAVTAGTINTGQGNNELYAMNQNVMTSSAVSFTTINTGFGANELYQMNQNVMTSSAVSFTTIDTGFGANELYPMNQNVMTSSAVSFTTINTGFGANELYQMNQNVMTSSAVSFTTIDTGFGANELYPMNQDVRTSASPTFVGIGVQNIAEGTADGGVTVDGVLLKDGLVDGIDVNALDTSVSGHTASIAANAAKLDQDVLTTSSPTFATIDTGFGANELYAMNQDVLTTSSPTFMAVSTDTINENTLSNGVLVDGVLLKDGLVDGVDVAQLKADFDAGGGGASAVVLSMQDAVLPCHSSPCGVGFTCQASGFSQYICIDIDDCASAPCASNTHYNQCFDLGVGSGEYKCVACDEGYVAASCDDVHANLCVNPPCICCKRSGGDAALWLNRYSGPVYNFPNGNDITTTYGSDAAIRMTEGLSGDFAFKYALAGPGVSGAGIMQETLLKQWDSNAHTTYQRPFTTEFYQDYLGLYSGAANVESTAADYSGAVECVFLRVGDVVEFYRSDSSMTVPVYASGTGQYEGDWYPVLAHHNSAGTFEWRDISMAYVASSFEAPAEELQNDCASSPCSGSSPLCVDGEDTYSCINPCDAGEVLVACDGGDVDLCGGASPFDRGCVCCERANVDSSLWHSPNVFGGPWTFTATEIRDNDSSKKRMIRTNDPFLAGNWQVEFELGISGQICDRVGVGFTPDPAFTDAAIAAGNYVSPQGVETYSFENGGAPKYYRYDTSDRVVSDGNPCGSRFTWKRVDSVVSVHVDGVLKYTYPELSDSNMYMTIGHHDNPGLFGLTNVAFTRVVTEAWDGVTMETFNHDEFVHQLSVAHGENWGMPTDNRVVGYATGLGAARPPSQAYFGATYSPTLRRVYFTPAAIADAGDDTWHYYDSVLDTVVAYVHGLATRPIDHAYLGGGAYVPSLDRIYWPPAMQGTQPLWHYVDCANGGAIVAYAHGQVATVEVSTGGAFRGGVFSATLNRVYFSPFLQGYSVPWFHYVDVNSNLAVPVWHEFGVLVTQAYAGGVIAPTLNRLILTPYRQATNANWHYLDFNDDGRVKQYAHGAAGLTDYAYQGATWSPVQNRVYWAGTYMSNQANNHYYDCDTETVQSYAAATPSPVQIAWSGLMYVPSLNRIYYVPGRQAQASANLFYIDCNDGSVVQYSNGLQGDIGTVELAYGGAALDPVRNRLILAPYFHADSGTDTWHYIDVDEGTATDEFSTPLFGNF